MENFKANNRTQLTLFDVCLEQILPDNHLARRIVEHVSQFDRNLFAVRKVPGGKPQFDPLSVLALLLYCFVHSYYTSRKIEWAASEWRGAQYILAMCPIDHSTICRFIGRNSSAICKVFYDFMDIVEAEGLVSSKEVTVDGTKIPASAGSHNSVKYGDFQKVLKKAKKMLKQLIGEGEELLVSINSCSDDPDQDFDQASDLEKAFIKKTKQIQKAKKKIWSLEQAKENLEQEARDKAADEHRRELERRVLAPYRDEIERLTNMMLDYKAEAAGLEERKERLKSELPSRQAVKNALKPWRHKRRMKARHDEIVKYWKDLCTRIRADLNANCRSELSPEELEKRKEKFLSPDKQMNTTDPDSRSMRLANKSYDMAYSVQLGIDKKSKMALHVKVTRDGNDLYQLRPMIRAIEENFGAVEKVNADCGYHVEHELDVMEVFGVDLWVPANHDDSKRKVKIKKRTATGQALRMERKRQLPEYKRRAKERKEIEAEIGDTKFNDRLGFFYYRGIEKVTTVITLKFLAHNMESFILYKEKLRTEGKVDHRSLKRLEKSKFEKAVADFHLIRGQVLPRQQTLRFE